MNKIIVISLTVISVLALGFGLYNFLRPAPILVQNSDGDIVTVGAMPGNELQGPCFKVNGVETCYARVDGRTASTTLCSIKAPSATSTLVNASVEIISSSSTAGLITIAKAASTSNNATTTLLGSQYLLTVDTRDTIHASTTAAQLSAEAEIFGPNTYLNVGIQHGGGLLNTQKAICEAEFRLVN
jgi:hypothetical protein